MKTHSTLQFLLVTSILAGATTAQSAPDDLRNLGEEIRAAVREAIQSGSTNGSKVTEERLKSLSWIWGENGEEARAARTVPFLGIVPEAVPDVLRFYVDLQEDSGVLVARVVKSGPAEAAGLQANDIILSISGVAVGSQKSLSERIREHKVGDELQLRILRQGRELDLVAILGERRTSGGWRAIQEGLPKGLDQIPAQIPDSALRALEGIDQWIPGSVRIMVDDDERIRVDLKDLQVSLKELREKLEGLRGEAPNGSADPTVARLRDTEGRQSLLHLGERSLAFSGDEGKLVMEPRADREYFRIWNVEGELCHEGYYDEIEKDLDEDARTLVRRFRESFEKMVWNQSIPEPELLVPETDPAD